MRVEGNAESLYFGKDDKEKYIGANRATSATNGNVFWRKENTKSGIYR
jgi:hypothetical protein